MVKNGTPGSKVLILDWCGLNQSTGFHKMTWPSAHDTTRNLYAGLGAALLTHLIPLGPPPVLRPQETITYEMIGSATGGDIEQGLLTLLYEDLPGIQGRLISPDDVWNRAKSRVTISATLACGTGGGWSGSEAITSESNLLHANTDYAVLGITTKTSAMAVGIKAPDFGNVRIAVPGALANHDMYGNYFMHLSEEYGLPLVPVFNSANRDSILLDGMVDENGTDPIVTVHLVELSQ